MSASSDTPAEHPCPDLYRSILTQPKEYYVTHGTLYEPSKTDHTDLIPFTLLVTNLNYYKVIPQTDTVEWTRPLLEIHSIEEQMKPEAFKVVVHTPFTKNKILSTKLETFLHEFLFVASSQDKKEEWIMVLRAVVRNLWQSHFEATLMPQESEIYQFHLFVCKVNTKGRTQVRCLVISTERIYNVQAVTQYPLHAGKLKWSFQISSITKINVSVKEPRLLSFFTSAPKLTKELQFLFKDAHERAEVIQELRRLYKREANKDLPVEELTNEPDNPLTLRREASKFGFLYK